MATSIARRLAPHQAAVVGGHRELPHELEVLFPRQAIDRLEIADAGKPDY